MPAKAVILYSQFWFHGSCVLILQKLQVPAWLHASYQ
jgi:hypothetical protein